MKRLLATASLFGSLGTIVCCVLPTAFVVLGFGATFAGLMGAFPELIWFSTHKGLVFGTGGVLLALNVWTQLRPQACPADPKLAAACQNSKRWSRWLLCLSGFLYVLGVVFAFLIPLLVGG